MKMAMIACALLLTGCGKGDQAAEGRTDTTATFLGTVDGCKLWRIFPSEYGPFNMAHCDTPTATTSTQVSHEEVTVTGDGKYVPRAGGNGYYAEINGRHCYVMPGAPGVQGGGAGGSAITCSGKDDK